MSTAAFQPLGSEDYSTDMDMDDVSLASSKRSGLSISSRFSQRSKHKKSSSLGVSLTASASHDHEEGLGVDWAGSPSGSAPQTANSYISEDDPFYMFRSDLKEKLNLVDDELSNYHSIIRTTDTAVNTHQLKEAKKRLKRLLKHAESSLNDLETTVRVVEKQREKFPHIRDGEIQERRKFVDDSKDQLAMSKMSMQSEEVRNKLMSDERALTERRKGGRTANGNASASSTVTNGNGSNGAYRNMEEGNPERAETLLMMQQQDETLDDLDMAVTRVGYMAETIHEEIETQNIMLKDLEDDLADAEEQLGVVMGKLAKLLKTKSKCQLGMILILSLIVLVLFFLVLYT